MLRCKTRSVRLPADCARSRHRAASRSTAIGANCVDGAVVAVEKPLLSKMLVEGSGRRVHMIDDHIGGVRSRCHCAAPVRPLTCGVLQVMAGLVADGRQLVNRARQEAQAYRRNYAESIPPHVRAATAAVAVAFATCSPPPPPPPSACSCPASVPAAAQILADRMSQFAHAYTCYDALRPFGASLIIIGYDERARKHEMYLIEPSGVGLVRAAAAALLPWAPRAHRGAVRATAVQRHFGCAVGKGRQAAKTEIEKAGVMGKTCREALTDLAKTCVAPATRAVRPCARLCVMCDVHGRPQAARDAR